MLVDGYVRVSTQEQSREGISEGAQRSRIEAYLSLFGADHGLELRRVAVEEDGASAKTLQRPALQGVLADLRSGAIGGVVVYKLDRLTRSLGDWDFLVNNFFGERPGKRLVSVNEQINTSTAMGRMMLNMIVLIAQWERETISERTAENLGYKIERGERCGKVRYGFRVGPDGKKLLPVPSEQLAILAVRSLRADGYSLRAIADHLHRLGFRPREGAEKWAPNSLARILSRSA